MAKVISYVRFSRTEQERGDSVRRQAGLRDEWLKRHPQHVMDEKLNDLGVSGFKGRNLNPEYGALGKFIGLCKAKKVPSGSILLLENLDRFSRLPPRKVFHVFCELVECGITIQTLSPEQTINESNIDSMEVILPTIISMQLSYQESAKKAERLNAAWVAKREKARNDRTPVSRRGPGWLKWDDEKGEWIIQPGAKQCLRYIFERTCEGVGQTRLLAEIQEKFAPFGRSTRWLGSMLSAILTGRAVLGEYTPLRKSNPQAPILDYFPRMIPDELWHRARAASESRKHAKGPNSGFVNLFTGLIKFPDGFNGHVQTVFRGPRSNRKKLVTRSFVSAGYRDGMPGACSLTVPVEKVENVVLNLLHRIQPSDLAPTDGPDPTASKRGELAGVDARLAELTAALTDSNQPVAVLTQAIRDLSAKRDSIRREIDALESHRATAKAKPLQGVQDVLATIDAAPESERHGLRLKLRQLIAAAVRSILIRPYRVEGKKVDCEVSVVTHDAGTIELRRMGGLTKQKSVPQRIVEPIPARLRRALKCGGSKVVF